MHERDVSCSTMVIQRVPAVYLYNHVMCDVTDVCVILVVPLITWRALIKCESARHAA